MKIHIIHTKDQTIAVSDDLSALIAISVAKTNETFLSASEAQLSQSLEIDLQLGSGLNFEGVVTYGSEDNYLQVSGQIRFDNKDFEYSVFDLEFRDEYNKSVSLPDNVYLQLKDKINERMVSLYNPELYQIWSDREYDHHQMDLEDERIGN